MNKALWLSLFAALSTAGCYLGTDGAMKDGTGTTGNGTSDGNGSTSGSGSSNGVIDGASSGLPCDVIVMLQRHCTTCHGSPTSGGAPQAMLTYDDLTAAATSVPGKSVAQLSLDRIKDGSMPPKPAPGPSASELAAFETWVNAGAPRGTCDVPIDAGPVAPNPYDTPLQCSSGSNWSGGTRESPDMKPGGACISCHNRGEGPSFSIAGTVYPSAHEPDDCNGLSGRSSDVTVVITGADGVEIPLQVNAAGNFFTEQPVALPYHARVTSGGQERAMSATQTSGDCNSCHTVNGTNNAPGRIMAP